jgi:SMP-30/Gluconolactonase/LRE-like region
VRVLLSRLCVVILPVALAACSDLKIDTSCAASGDVVPICGVQMPEDLVVLPGGGGLLISEYGDMGHLPGALTWYQPGGGSSFIKLVDSNNIAEGSSAELWGEADCVVPQQLSPHGIHLSQRGDSLQLLVVNHSAIEQVLMYEVVPSGQGEQPPALAWRGCVQFPEHAVLNDVAATPDGGFAVTHMYDRENEKLAQLKSVLGFNDGHVWRWIPGQGSHVMANSEAKMPNGIEVSADGKSLWVNNYIELEVRQYDVATEAIISTVEVPNIDNSAWLEDGRLLVASHVAPLAMGVCFGVTEGSCGAPYELVAVDVTSGETEVIFSSGQGGPFGPATVAVPYRGKLYAGSFSGDRLAEITLR